MIRFIRKNKNTVLAVSLILLFCVALVLQFHKYIVQKNFYVYIQVPCSDSVENCFQGDESEYIKIYHKAFYLEACSETGCDLSQCTEDMDCYVVECNEDSLEEGETCI